MPTYDKEGIRVYNCVSCQATKTESVPKLVNNNTTIQTTTGPEVPQSGTQNSTVTVGQQSGDQNNANPAGQQVTQSGMDEDLILLIIAFAAIAFMGLLAVVALGQQKKKRSE